MTIALLLLGGLLLLYLGAEALVAGSSSAALRLGLRPLVVGLTFVAFGTSAPELVVSVSSAVKGSAGVATGNAIGSNLVNILLILGLSSLIRPLGVERSTLRAEIPFALGTVGLAWILAADGALSRLDGAVLLVAFGAFLAYCLWLVRSRPDQGGAPPARPLGASLLLGGAGLAALVAGAELFVRGAVGMARAAGVSELVIGLTVVAAGTSLPELATSVLAAVRGRDDLSVGNIVGSNVFNAAAILGAAALVAPLPVGAEELGRDFPAVTAATLLLLLLGSTGGRLARWEGGAMLAAYGGYLAWMMA